MTNTTLYNIIHSELINRGKNEFFNNNKFTFHSPEFSFMQKVLAYDEDVDEIVTYLFFNGLRLDSKESDLKFKRHFISYFLDRSPAYQTLEIFSSKVVYIFLNNEDFLNRYYDDLDDYLNGKATSSSKGNRESLSDSRSATATLPQDRVNIDVDNTTLDYADENHIARSKDRSKADDESLSYNLNLDNLLNSRAILEQVFEDFDRQCFLQVF